ncbi:MAG: histone deacetylase [Bacillota bacterium]
MSEVCLIYHHDYLEHRTGDGHLEAPGRLRAILDLLDREGVLSRLHVAKPREATLEELCLAHSPGYVEVLRAFGDSGGGYLDPDTFMSPGSFRAASLGAGGTIEAVEACLAGLYPSTFVLARPPGHHASRSQATGFCLFNNVVVGALHALRHPGIRRVLVIDWDLHHGNGTESLLYQRQDVLYFSVHQSPCYPGTGSLQDLGDGEGLGYNLNVPLPGGVGDRGYDMVFQEILMPVALRYQPDLVMVSAGQDCHHADPLGGMMLTTHGFHGMARQAREIARECAAGRIVLCLEGGYHLEALSHSVLAIIDALGDLGLDVTDPLGDPGETPVERIRDRLAQVRNVMSPHWQCLA